jgi:hypothetical protein
VLWELDHRCRGKGKKHIIEVHYDSDDGVCEDIEIELDAYVEQGDDASDSCTEASDSDTLEEDIDSCTLVYTSGYGMIGEDGDPCVEDRKSEEQKGNTDVSTDISHGVDDSTPQQSDDTSMDLHMLAPRFDELPMRAVTHLSSFQAPMIATSHEDISGMSYIMEEPWVRDAHHGHVDPQIQEEIRDIQTVDLTHTDQHEDIEPQLLETPLVEQIADTDRLMGHFLPGSACIDEDALFTS